MKASSNSASRSPPTMKNSFTIAPAALVALFLFPFFAHAQTVVSSQIEINADFNLNRGAPPYFATSTTFVIATSTTVTSIQVNLGVVSATTTGAFQAYMTCGSTPTGSPVSFAQRWVFNNFVNIPLYALYTTVIASSSENRTNSPNVSAYQGYWISPPNPVNCKIEFQPYFAIGVNNISNNTTTNGISGSGLYDYRPYYVLYGGSALNELFPIYSDSVFFSTLSTSTCTVFNISGCFQNALLWAFYPPTGVFNGILSLKDLIAKKPPFGYFDSAKDQIAALGTTTTPAFSLTAVSGINTYIFGPIDAGLAAIWWAIVGIWFFFHRARHIDI